MGSSQSSTTTTTPTNGCMCYSCKFDNVDAFGTCDMKKCSNTHCNNQMTSGSHALCMECSTTEEKCYECGKPINFDDSELENHINILTDSKNNKCKLYEKLKLEGVDPTAGIKKHYISVHEGLINGKKNFI